MQNSKSKLDLLTKSKARTKSVVEPNIKKPLTVTKITKQNKTRL